MDAKILEIKIFYDPWIYRWMAGVWHKALLDDGDRLVWRSVDLADIPTKVLKVKMNF